MAHTGSGEVVHPVTPAELRAHAARLEREAGYAEIRKGSFCGYQFDAVGRCYEQWLVEVPCPNHEEPYHDEYNYGLNYCSHCRRSDGKMRVFRTIAAPQYNAPKPPKEYTP